MDSVAFYQSERCEIGRPPPINHSDFLLYQYNNTEEALSVFNKQVFLLPFQHKDTRITPAGRQPLMPAKKTSNGCCLMPTTTKL